MKDYLWSPFYDGNYVLEYVENTETRVIRHEVNYPIKGDVNGWYFFTSKNIEGEDFAHEVWDLPIEEQKEIKKYIREILKPSDLYEEKEKENMDTKTILHVAVPNELAEEVMSIISRFEGIPVGNDDIAQLVNLSVKQELEVSKADKENLIRELDNNRKCLENLQSKYEYLHEDAKLIMQNICSEMQDRFFKNDFNVFMQDHFTEAQIDRYELNGFVEQKYNVVSVDITMETTKTIKVVCPVDVDIDSYLSEIDTSALQDFCEDGEPEFTFVQGNTLDSEVTAEQVSRHHSQENMFYTDEVGRDIYN